MEVEEPGMTAFFFIQTNKLQCTDCALYAGACFYNKIKVQISARQDLASILEVGGWGETHPKILDKPKIKHF